MFYVEKGEERGAFLLALPLEESAFFPVRSVLSSPRAAGQPPPGLGSSKQLGLVACSSRNREFNRVVFHVCREKPRGDTLGTDKR